MFGILFRVEAKPGKHQELLDFLQWDGEVCRDQEPGTLRFEFYRDPNDANALYVYEAYRDCNAFEAHKTMSRFGAGRLACSWSWALTSPCCSATRRHGRRQTNRRDVLKGWQTKAQAGSQQRREGADVKEPSCYVLGSIPGLTMPCS